MVIYFNKVSNYSLVVTILLYDIIQFMKVGVFLCIGSPNLVRLAVTIKKLISSLSLMVDDFHVLPFRIKRWKTYNGL